MRRLATAAVIALACGSIWVAVAIANGGSSIASAPDMPIGQQVASGYTHPQYGEFWRVNLSAGDELVIDYGVPAGSGSLDLYVYSPGVTDYTLSDAEPAVSDETALRLVAASFPSSCSWDLIARRNFSTSRCV